MSEKNPFSVLGFSPSAFKGLADGEILQLASAMRKAQMLVRHTDAGGTDAQASALNQAMDEIENNLEYWKERFLKTRKDKLSDLEAEASKQGDALRQTEDALLSFWKDIAARDQFSALNIRPGRIILLNMIEALVVGKALAGIRSRYIPQPNQKLSFHRGLEVAIEADGSLTMFGLDREGFNPTRPPEGIPEDMIMRAEKPGDTYFWKRQDSGRRLEGVRLVGSLSIDKMRTERYKEDREALSLHRLLPLMPPDSTTAENIENARNGFPIDILRSCLRFASPRFDPYSLLVAADVKKPDRLLVLGQILRVRI